MNDAERIEFIYYEGDRVPDHAQGDALDVSDAEMQRARNRILEVCAAYGSIGWTGKWLGGDTYGDFEIGDDDPNFNVDSEWRNTEHYLYLATDDHATSVSIAWIRELMSVLRSHLPLWGVCVTDVSLSYAIVFHNKIMVTGPQFIGVGSLSEFIDRWKQSKVADVDCRTDDEK